MKDSYITAITEELLAGQDIDLVLKKAHSLISKKGHLRLWPLVLRGVVRELEKQELAKQPKVVVAKSESLNKEAIATSLKKLGLATDVTYKVKIDDTIIGGHILSHKDQMIDASFKRQLVELYQKTTRS